MNAKKTSRKIYPPNDKHWQQKADRAWGAQVCAIGHCEICPYVGKLDPHHLIRRGKFRYRYDLDNGICLCPGHHTFHSKDGICVHGNIKEVERFGIWLRKNKPEQWKWFLEHEQDKRDYLPKDDDYLTRQDAYNQLTQTQGL